MDAFLVITKQTVETVESAKVARVSITLLYVNKHGAKETLINKILTALEHGVRNE